MPADLEGKFVLVTAGFLDERGVRWTLWIALLTGRF